jgi:DNA topoisomerase-1
MMKRWGRNGWFLGCSTFPKCKSTRNVPLGVDCPKCGGEVVEIRARGRKRPFYGCRNFSDKEIKCDFRMWQRPYPESCPQCAAKYLVRGGSRGAPTMRCLTDGCDYSRPLTEDEIGRGSEDGEDQPATAAGA